MFPFSLSRIMLSALLRIREVLSALVVYIIWLPHLHDLFLLILVHVHTSVHCLILPCFRAYVKLQPSTHAIMSILCIVLLPVWGFQI
jgi:hypothetical protein